MYGIRRWINLFISSGNDINIECELKTVFGFYKKTRKHTESANLLQDW